MQSPAPRIPTLTPARYTPEQRRTAPTPSMAFLKTIECVEFDGIEVSNGVAYYVLHVHLRQSRIPTVLRRKERQHLPLKDVRRDARLGEPHMYSDKRPDIVVKRSFRQFDELRRQICAHLDKENRGNCCACNDWMSFMMFNMTKAGIFMKLVPSRSLRQQNLSKFINAAVLLSIQATVKPSRRQQCNVNDSIAQCICEFLQKNELCNQV